MRLSQAVALIRSKIQVETVDVALILGSGLGAFAEQIDGVSIDYSDVPGFPMPVSLAMPRNWLSDGPAGPTWPFSAI